MVEIESGLVTGMHFFIYPELFPAFGLPPSLPTSAQVKALADGEVALLAVELMKQAGIPCDSLKADPAFAAELDEGVPPGKVQAYALIVPSGSLPLPEKLTEPPGAIVTSVAGLLMIAVGR